MTKLKLPNVCNRAATEIVRDDLIEALGSETIDGPYPVDASEVEQMSHAALQLLVSAAKTGPGVQIDPASDAFRDAVKLAGLEHVFWEASET